MFLCVPVAAGDRQPIAPKLEAQFGWFMVACPSSVQTWLPPLLRDCLLENLGTLYLTSMMATIMLTGMYSSLASAEPMMIVPVGPRNDTTSDLSFRHEQAGFIITLVPWAISTIGKAVSIDGGTGPAFFSNYKFAGRDFGGPVQIVSTVGAGFSVIPGCFVEYRLQHFSDAGAYGPYKVGVDMHLLEINFRF